MELFKHLQTKTSWLYITIIVSIVVFGLLSYRFYQLKNEPEEITHGSCLADDEFADYPLDERYAKELKIPKIPLIISIRDKNTNQKKISFQIDNVIKSYHSLELYKCGIYIIREFNFDSKENKPLPDFSVELWKYRYNGEGERILVLADEDEFGESIIYYGFEFRVDPLENYLVLRRGYLGEDKYALIIKDLKNQEDVFVLTLNEVLNQYSNIQPGSFDLGIWTPDGKYLWGVFYAGALDTAYYRTEAGTWKTNVLSPPDDLPSGAERDFNFKGWLAYVDMTSFAGIKEITEQIEEEAKKVGRMKNLWIYNLFTKEKNKITSANPEWRFDLKWISDTELEYYLPPGERKVYNIENK